MNRLKCLEKFFKASIAKAALMIAGTTIGAGMLGIPLVTGEIGYAAGAVVTLCVWLYMYFTGIALMEVSVSLREKGGFIQMAKTYLPFFGKEITASLFVFLYGILLVAYISAGSQILALAAGGSLIAKIAFPIALFFVLALRDKKVITIISVLTFPMWVYFILFFYTGSANVQLDRLMEGEYSKMYIAVPLLFGAFGYHNVIPTISQYLNYDKRRLKKAIFIGSFIPCAVYLLWQGLILGMVDSETLALAREKGVPAVALVGQVFKGSLFGNSGVVFAFFAIITSALGVGISVVQFVDRKQSFPTIIGVVLVPTLIAFIYPGIFLSALSFAGGFGESLLNGVIPVWMFYVYKKLKGKMTNALRFFAFSLLIIAVIVLFIELYSFL